MAYNQYLNIYMDNFKWKYWMLKQNKSRKKK